ncbi:class I SAM-dependent methyltransferase, partial [Cribrihabitans sp. XS_ASV171]
MSKKFLSDAYRLETPEQTRDHYDAWAASYDAEIAENGYATPGRVADALWACAPMPEIPIMDYGCGTGLSGLALRRAGYTIVDGMDPSTEMLAGAREKGAYRELTLLDLGKSAPIAQGAYH